VGWNETFSSILIVWFSNGGTGIAECDRERTVQMMDALLKQHGKKLIFAGKEVYAIWSPEDMEKVSETDLRDLR